MINCHLSCLFICTYLFCQSLMPVLDMNVWLWKWSLPQVGWLITAHHQLILFPTKFGHDLGAPLRSPRRPANLLRPRRIYSSKPPWLQWTRPSMQPGREDPQVELKQDHFHGELMGKMTKKHGFLRMFDDSWCFLSQVMASYSWGELPKNKRILIFSDRPSCQTIMSNLQDHASQFLFDARWGWGTEFSARCPYDPYGYGQYGSRFLPFGNPWKITIIHLEIVYFHGQFLLAATLSKIAQGYQQLDWTIDKFGWWWCFGTQMVQIWWPSGPQIVNP